MIGIRQAKGSPNGKRLPLPIHTCISAVTSVLPTIKPLSPQFGLLQYPNSLDKTKHASALCRSSVRPWYQSNHAGPLKRGSVTVIAVRYQLLSIRLFSFSNREYFDGGIFYYSNYIKDTKQLSE